MFIRQLLLVVFSCSLPACASTVLRADPPAVPKANARVAPTVVNPKPEDDATRGIIRVAQDVRGACGLANSEAFFSFDSSAVRFEDKKGLRALADCFMSGPLKGRQMSLVGHADPRGSEDYNLALGGRRADNVKRIIVAESMSNNRVSTTSRGEMDATGTDEASWAMDRSVDVTLAK